MCVWGGGEGVIGASASKATYCNKYVLLYIYIYMNCFCIRMDNDQNSSLYSVINSYILSY
jgi:hypothetical protein